MLASVRYEKGHGDNVIFARARNQSSQFYNFITTGWDVAESADTKVFLVEYVDGDPIDSMYSADVAFPIIESMQEIVDSTISLVIGYGVYTPPANNNGSLTLADIEASTVLLKAADPRLDAISVIENNTAVVNTDLSDIADALMGSWEIIGTQMIFHKRDGSELMRFNLTDKFGNASDHSVFKRTKV